MTGKKGISFEKCGHHYLLNYNGFPPSILTQVSGHTQNWFDADGTASGLNVPTFIMSGYAESASWFQVDDEGKSGCFLRIFLNTYICCLETDTLDFFFQLVMSPRAPCISFVEENCD
jgi:hypothetical protein